MNAQKEILFKIGTANERRTWLSSFRILRDDLKMLALEACQQSEIGMMAGTSEPDAAGLKRIAISSGKRHQYSEVLASLPNAPACPSHLSGKTKRAKIGE